MGTNKDQLQAHQFMLQRVISALTVHETDPEQPPFRRPTIAAVSAFAVAVLTMAAVWVYGLVVPGGDRFTAQDVIAVEKETGARFVLMNGRLHPVVNYTSALLALDRHAEVRLVSHATLAGIPAGPAIGISDAPDSLPGRGQLLTGGWSSCAQSTVDNQGRRQELVVLLVGHPPDQGGPLGGLGLLVHSGGRQYLLYSGYRHELTAGVDVALDLGKESPVGVSGTWLDMVPAGKPLGPVPVADAGRASTAVPGMNLLAGQLLLVEDGPQNGRDNFLESQFYLVLGDQLRPVSPLQATIQRALDPHADPPVVVGNRALVGATRAAPQPPADDDPPRSRPRFWTVDNPDAAVCATFRPGDPVPQLVVGVSLSSADRVEPGRPVRVAVPGGRAALIEVVSGPDQQPGQGTVALVTDQGRLYPLADPAHNLQVLGFDGVPPVRVTSALADRVPRGRSLSQDAARTPVPAG
jgi:type VII secretion protein EccB